MKAPLIFLAVAAMGFAADAPAPKVEDIAKSYKTLGLLTPKPRLNLSPIYPCARPATREELAWIREMDKGLHTSWYVNHYRNALAATVTDKAFPAGSVLIKEKLKVDVQTPILPLLRWRVHQIESAGKTSIVPYEPLLRTSAIAGMIKRPAGTLPKSGDWEFFWFENGKLTTTGLESCAGCHSGAKRDFVFTDLPKKAR